MNDRRKFLRAALFVAAAPIIVRSSSLMKIVAPAQGFPYYGGLATMEKVRDDYARDYVQTRWTYDDGHLRAALGFITTDMLKAENPGVYDLQLSALRNCAENVLGNMPGYREWLSRKYGVRLA